VGVAGPSLELVGQQGVEQLRQAGGQQGRFDLLSEHDEGCLEPGQLTDRPSGDVAERQQQRQPGVVVGQAAQRFADQLTDPVEDDGGHDLLAVLAIDQAVGPVDVAPELAQRRDDAAADVDGQAALQQGRLHLWERSEPAGQRDLAAVQRGLLPCDPGRGRRCAGELVQPAEVDVGDPGQSHRAQDLELLQQHRRLGQRLRARQPSRHLGRQLRHGLHQQPGRGRQRRRLVRVGHRHDLPPAHHSLWCSKAHHDEKGPSRVKPAVHEPFSYPQGGASSTGARRVLRPGTSRARTRHVPAPAACQHPPRVPAPGGAETTERPR